MILTGERLSVAVVGERLDPRSYLLRMHPDLAEAIPPLEHVVLTAPPLRARVNHGIWIWSCPCGSRGVPRPGGPVFVETLLGWCARCQNQATGRGWRPLLVPPPDERRRIEAVLVCRPNVGDQNWEPAETIDELLRQNAEHGDSVPDVDAEPPLETVRPPALWLSDAARAVLADTRPKRRRFALVGRR